MVQTPPSLDPEDARIAFFCDFEQPGTLATAMTLDAITKVKGAADVMLCGVARRYAPLEVDEIDVKHGDPPKSDNVWPDVDAAVSLQRFLRLGCTEKHVPEKRPKRYS